MNEERNELNTPSGSLADFLDVVRGRRDGTIALKRQYDEGDNWEESARLAIRIGGYQTVLKDAEFFMKENH
jgi:hypothetical protein